MSSSTGNGHEAPPPIETNVINLVSVKDGKITNVSLYSSRAEVTRVFKCNVRLGLNQVHVNGLPNVLDEDSVKVEGLGHATIHDVTIASISPSGANPTTSDKLEGLLRQKQKTEQAINRCNLAIQSLETYIGTLNVKDIGVTDVTKIVKGYQTMGEELDNELTELQGQLKRLNEDISAEKSIVLAGTVDNEKLRMRVSVSLFAEEGEVEVRLTYAVYSASWRAGYDIRVNTLTKEKAVELTYKASITQSTGEDWSDVILTLETANPSFGAFIPYLPPWTISAPIYRSPKRKSVSVSLQRATSAPMGRPAIPSVVPESSDAGVSFYAMAHQETEVNSRGNITATFAVPGKISIPSDNAAHNVTIVKLNLDAKMSWVSVPKQETKAHFSAKIKNLSDYTLLSGQANVYVDGSFISRLNVPLVSPEESFDCPLGLDSSIRITYHPQSKKTTRSSGFYNKTVTHVIVQRITVLNTKTTAIDQIKVMDQFPVSSDSTIVVRQVSPELSATIKRTANGELKVNGPINISSGVVAQWHDADEPDVNVESLGKDGKFDWICSIPAQGKVDLTLQFEVTTPPQTPISGL